MLFTQDEVNKLAQLARLSTNKESATSIAEDLHNILQMISKIGEIKTNDIEPMEHSQNATQRCRTDIVSEPNVRDEIQKLVTENAKTAGLYLVPTVIE